MTVKYLLIAALLCLVPGGAHLQAADAQQQPAKHAATKSKPRSFNPYEVQRTRLRINGLGAFTLLPSSAATTSVGAVSQLNSETAPKQAITPPAQPVARSATTSEVASSSSQLLTAAAAGLSPVAAPAAVGTSVIAASSGFVAPSVSADLITPTRPPFRPPVRSPFRPPPRPPF